MKLTAFAVATFSALSAFAGPSQVCLKAKNPEVIQVQREGSKNIRKAKFATLSLKTTADEFSSEGEQKTGIMDIVTSSGAKVQIYSLVIPQLRTTIPTYSVECDGGKMTLESAKLGQMTANSDYIRGEIKSTSPGEGCSNATVKFEGLVFNKVACK